MLLDKAWDETFPSSEPIAPKKIFTRISAADAKKIALPKRQQNEQ